MAVIRAETNPEIEINTDKDEQTLRIQPWNVVLLDDNDHTFEYVIQMLSKILSIRATDAAKMAQEVHTSGRVIVFTGSRERCELIQEQIHSWGADPLVPRCKGSMRAVLEQAD